MNQIHNNSDDFVTLSNLDAETLSDVVARPGSDDVEGLREFGLMSLRAKRSISNSTEEEPCDFTKTQIQKHSSETFLSKSNSGAISEKSDSLVAPKTRVGFTKIEMQLKNKAEQARRCVLICRFDSC